MKILWDWHNRVSITKSSLRIIGFILLPVNLFAAAAALIAAEIGGIMVEYK